MDIEKMSKKQFKEVVSYAELSAEQLDEFKGKVTSIVIIPTTKRHCEGLPYKDMEYVCCNHLTPLFRINGGSDVLHINGIGGYGLSDDILETMREDAVPAAAWRIDCLPCGYLRLWGVNRIALDEMWMASDYSVYKARVREEEEIKD